MNQPASEKELWVRMSRGDMKSTEALYMRYYDLLLNYGLKYCGNADLVLDCIQDLFLKLHGRRSLKPVIYVRSYLLNSLQHLIYDRLSRTMSTEELDERMFLFGEEDVPDDELIRTLQEECNALPPRTRQALYLRYVNGLSYSEIAEVMKIRIQSCMNLVNRAVTRLKTKIEK